MGFDSRDIRPSMDVYSRDNVYLGTVLEVIPGLRTPLGDSGATDARQTSAVSGVLLGPAPTQPLGNKGPIIQSARAHYATTPDTAQPLGRGAIVVGKWWGLVGRHTISLDAVHSLSMERIILELRKDELAQL